MNRHNRWHRSEPEVRKGVTHVALSSDSWTPEMLLRLQRLGRELRLTDQILSTDLDTVTITDGGPAPAWTSLEGDHVTFAMHQMPFPKERVDVAVWLGTNAHELGHVLFSPRLGSPLMSRVLEAEKLNLPGLAQMANVAEDQRQERLLLGLFAPWRPYLVAALGHHLVASDELWLLVAGRTWLPDEVRMQAYVRMVAQYGRTMADAVTQLIDDYQQLVDPGTDESDEAWRILTELHNLFDLHQPDLPHGCTVIEGGQPQTGEPGQGTPPTATEKPCTPEGSGGDGEPSGEAGDGDKPDGKDGKSEGNTSGSGAGSKPGKPIDTTSVKKTLRAAASKELDGQGDAAAEVGSVMDALRHGRAGDRVSGQDAAGRHVAATPAAVRLHREVSDALLDLKDSSEPGWIKRVEYGRLNVRRLLDPMCPVDEIFDRYEPGQMDASDFDVAVLVDISGSMGSQMFALAESVWAIRRAVDDLEGRCTVIAWESGPHWIVNQPGDRPDDRMFVLNARGGTDPTSALRETYQLLAGGQAKNRLMILLTDGDWSGFTADQSVQALNEAGVITVMVQLVSAYGFAEDAHGCRYGQTISELSDMARLFRRVAAEQIGQWR